MIDSTMLTFFWITTGLLTAFLARRKGKNPYLWFTIGTLMGVLGLLFLFIYTHKKGKQKIYIPKTKKTIKKPLSDIELFFHKNAINNRLWYYLDKEHTQNGPVSLTWLNNHWQKGHINSSTYVWNEEMGNWKRIKEFFPKKELSNSPQKA
jgi:hypothetical protein